MPTKPPARFTFLLDPELKQKFEELCAADDITPSQMMRQMIKTHISRHRAAKAADAGAKTRKPRK
jgi:predicted transcriptional regulator